MASPRLLSPVSPLRPNRPAQVAVAALAPWADRYAELVLKYANAPLSQAPATLPPEVTE